MRVKIIWDFVCVCVCITHSLIVYDFFPVYWRGSKRSAHNRLAQELFLWLLQLGRSGLLEPPDQTRHSHSGNCQLYLHPWCFHHFQPLLLALPPKRLG
jgi:hypothetical protein